MDVFCYVIAPIDHWGLSVPLDEFLDDLSEDDCADAYRARCELFVAEAKKLARQAGWEGDMSEGPNVFGIPPGDTMPNFVMGLAWKQDNNGTTFICSPVPLPWLGEPERVGEIEL